MKYYADLHIHSHYSMATSKMLTPEYLDLAARQKGISVVGTGDFTHPGWLAEMKEKLDPLDNGLFRLKNGLRPDVGRNINADFLPQFILTAEISNIYKKNGKVRKVHNVVLAPDFHTVERIQQSLQQGGFNITSDGRPILGLDSRDLLEMLLSVDERILLIPAHIWTPWFSALGARSGFDSIEECYEDLSQHITAVETGLSTDAPMNWMCSRLDKFTLLSNSDAHSPDKLGRNANIFMGEASYDSIVQALAQPDGRFGGTVDMYPQEGKYHYAGHRKCGICFDPVQTAQHQGICPVCGKKITMGVINRIVELSDRENIEERPNRKDFQYIIPLKEILSEIYQCGVQSKTITRQYNTLIQNIAAELPLLLETNPDEIESKGGKLLTEAIKRMRSGRVHIKEGFDGEYGSIKVFEADELAYYQQDMLFSGERKAAPKKRPLLNFDLSLYHAAMKDQKVREDLAAEPQKIYKRLYNEMQQKAVDHMEGAALVLAGPGTGKTHVLTGRIVQMVKEKNIDPVRILAVTFTRRAAGEMRERLAARLSREISNKMMVCTFHALGLMLLRENMPEKDINIISDSKKAGLIASALGLSSKEANAFCEKIATAKSKSSPEMDDDIRIYDEILEKNGLIDLEDLIRKPVLLARQDEGFRNLMALKYDYVLIDEYQDINEQQYHFLKLFLNRHQNLFAIGDPHQAIYGFRGADLGLIRRFRDDYPNAEIFNLEVSYRCPDNFIRAADSVLSEEVSQTHHTLYGMQRDIKISISDYASDKAEAEGIARIIEDLSGGLRFFSMDSGISKGNLDTDHALSGFGILCRTTRQFDCIAEALNNHSIPFKSSNDLPLFRKKNIAEALETLIGIYSKEEQTPEEYRNIPFLSAQNQMHENLRLILQHQKSMGIKTGKNEENQIVRIIARYNNNPQLLSDDMQLGSKWEEIYHQSEHVHLMTMHASKGLEFRSVFLPGLEQQLMPYTFFRQDADIAEEERLLYVAMTRAKEKLFLSHAAKRHLFGREMQNGPSYFLSRISESLLEREKREIRQKKKDEGDSQLSLF